MRMLIFLGLLFSCLSSLGQDPDFSDYRRKSENFSRIYDKQIRGELACFTIGGIEESLGKSPLRKWPVKDFGDNFITFDSNGVRITIRGAVFDPSRHKLAFEEKHLVKIDNRPFFGNFGKVPSTRVEKLIIIMGKDTLAIPPGAISDLYNPGFVYRDGSGNFLSQDAVYISPDKRRFYIYMLNKDDSGSYEVTWIIQDGQYLKRVLDFGFSK
jgi:hypothetical protein